MRLRLPVMRSLFIIKVLALSVTLGADPLRPHLCTFDAPAPLAPASANFVLCYLYEDALAMLHSLFAAREISSATFLFFLASCHKHRTSPTQIFLRCFY